MDYEQQKPPEAFETPLAQLEKLQAAFAELKNQIKKETHIFFSKHPCLLKVLVALDKMIYHND